MGERLSLRTVYEREPELSKLEPYLEILKKLDASIEERQSAKNWLEKKLLEYTRAQVVYGAGVSSRDSAAEQTGILEEFRDIILTALTDFADAEK